MPIFEAVPLCVVFNHCQNVTVCPLRMSNKSLGSYPFLTRRRRLILVGAAYACGIRPACGGYLACAKYAAARTSFLGKLRFVRHVAKGVRHGAFACRIFLPADVKTGAVIFKHVLFVEIGHRTVRDSLEENTGLRLPGFCDIMVV